MESVDFPQNQQAIEKLIGLMEVYPFEFSAQDLMWILKASEVPKLTEINLEAEYDSIGGLTSHLRHLLKTTDPQAVDNETVQPPWIRGPHHRSHFDMAIWRQVIRPALERDGRISYVGTRRGRKYRHVSHRPKLPTHLIARISNDILKACISQIGEMGWQDIYSNLFPVLVSVHRFAEGEEDTSISEGVPFEDTSISEGVPFRHRVQAELIEQYITGMNPDEAKQIQTPHKALISDWAASVYTEEWYRRSWPNIQRIMKAMGARVGSRRGLWLPPGIQSSIGGREADDDVWEELARVSSHIARARERLSRQGEEGLIRKLLQRELNDIDENSEASD